MEQQLRIAKAGAAWLALYVLASTAAYSIVDIYYYDLDSLYLVLVVMVWVLGYVLLLGLMRVSSWRAEPELGGIGGYFGLSLIAGIATLIGVILFLIPGLYLMLRWMPAYARLQQAGDGVQQALGWSWEATANIQKPLAIAMIGPVSTYAIFFAIAAYQEFYGQEISDLAYNLSYVALNLTVAVSVAWFQLLGVATYRLIQQHRDIPIETFT